MSGHNRWTKIKRKKEASDSKRSKVWTKIIKELTVAAKMGGGDANGNPRLRAAVDKARAANMPNDTIDRAIKKGTGESGDVQYEEFNYEVIGPGGSAMLVEILTDNRNRTASEVRSMLTRNNGTLAAQGAVAWQFKKQGIIAYDKAAANEDTITEAAIELGAEDVKSEVDTVVVVTDPKEFETVRDGLAKAGCGTPLSAEVTMVPQNTVRLTGDEARSAVKLVGLLEDNDDVQNVYSNLDVDDSELESES